MDGSPEDIQGMFKNMASARERTIDSAISLAYFMRGCIQYADVLMLSFYERSAISRFIESRFEAEKEKMYPIY